MGRWLAEGDCLTHLPRKPRSCRRAICLSGALIFLLSAVPSRPQERQSPDGALEALVDAQDTTTRLHESNDARVPPDAFLLPRAEVLAASGDYRIDALLSPYRWNVATVTYSFYEDDVFHGSYYGTETGVREVSDAVKANVRQIMVWYGTLMNISFVEVTEASNSIGAIRVMLSDSASYAYAYFPGNTSMTSLAGDIHLNPSYDRLGDTNGFQHPPGKHGYSALVHELGHTLGLKHSFEGGTILPAEEDNESHTVMTYTFTGNAAGTPMGYDVMALQYIYGLKASRTGDGSYQFTTRGTDQYDLGGTVYLSTPYRTRQAIWDSGGLDALDCTNLPYDSSGYRLDIRNLGWLVANSVYRTTDFDYGTVIANGVAFRDVVNSSSSDTIYANPQPNVFKGYRRTRSTGNDVIYAASPNDTLDLSGYLSSEVTDTRTGDDRVIGFGSNGKVTIKGWYTGSSLAVVFGVGSCTRANPTVTLSPANPSVYAANTAQYTVSVTNNDTGSCGDSSFILSSTLPVGWTSLITPSTLTIPQGQARTASLSKTAPTGTAPGAYSVAATATNGSYWGTGTASVTVQPPPTADFTITAFAAPSRGVIGGSVPISLSLSNQGSIGAGAFRVGFYFSTDASITTSDVFGGWFCNFPSGLAAGSTSGCSGVVGVPVVLTPGVYYLGAIADDTFAVVESNESNNVRVADTGPLKLEMPSRVGVYGAGRWRLDSDGSGDLDAGDKDFLLGWPGAAPVAGDWNGGGGTKAGVYSNGFWFLDYDGNGVWDGGVADKQIGWGWPGATPVMGDWNGDGKTEIGVYGGGFWFLDMNGDGVWDGEPTDKMIIWGFAGSTPVIGDWNGDGRTKVGLFCNGLWYLDYNGDGVWDGGTTDKVHGFGMSGVEPMVGDWNGDGKQEIGIYIGGLWFLDMNGNGVWDGDTTDRMAILGWSGTTPVVGDWNGDGRAKMGTFINGYWYLDYNGDGAWDGESTDKAYLFGQAGDTPIAGRW